jgi:hypothetical protein
MILLPGEAGHGIPDVLRQLRRGVADASHHRLRTELGDQIGLEVVPSPLNDLVGHVGGEDEVL